jgi:Uma2 family endonuclease
MARSVDLMAAERSTSPPPMTYEQFLAWCDEETHAEWVDGRVEFMPPVTDDHSEAGGFLLYLLQTYVSTRGLGKIRYEPYQMKIGPGMPGRSPDIMFIAAENAHRLTRLYLDGPADLVVEIVSRESRGRDRVVKFGEYERGGVREYWLIDPEQRLAEFFILDEDGRFHPAGVGKDGRYRGTVLAGLEFPVAWLCSPPPLAEVVGSLAGPAR